MKTLFLSALITAAACQAASASDLSSAYSDLDPEKDCTVLAAAEESDGEWADLVCNGHRGYPVFLRTSDLRDSLFYGFPPSGAEGPAWESFSAFNASGPKIEWRLATENGRSVPFATIHRRSVSTDDGGGTTEVLVVSRVGQPAERDGCVVGLVLAGGQPGANEKAREIADEHARDFACGTERPVSVGEPMPRFQRSE